MARSTTPKEAARQTADRQRRLQRVQDAKDGDGPSSSKPVARQTGSGASKPKTPAFQAGHREQPQRHPAQQTARRVQAEGRECLLIPADVKNADACRQAVAQTVQKFGKLDVLVNNAAFQLHAEGIEDISDERLDETFDTNIKGYFRMARAALPHLQRGASIINTGSVVGLRGSAHLLDYASTKGAIHAFTKSLAHNLLPRGIRVNAVAPGPVWTPLNPADAPADKVAEFGMQSDLKRAAQPEELSPAYVFLAAPCCSSYITGLVLPVTGSIGAI